MKEAVLAVSCKDSKNPWWQRWSETWSVVRLSAQVSDGAGHSRWAMACEMKTFEFHSAKSEVGWDCLVNSRNSTLVYVSFLSFFHYIKNLISLKYNNKRIKNIKKYLKILKIILLYQTY